ncbi:putative autoinducer 2 transporter [Campylobacter pinnipediorum subsp. pinnipediorum]|uniref:AI-2E family transporter n=1 Tax=Campylobacter pinnipediorum TaxID=1965231 RepID=UPI000994DC21|nr:AI-2E family transporter [Campylobacter pinnipediorum]AQW81236.1 putative autoinducer 2 transporter [Campylobacter pinnipediorum subsp. pinnipediorum]
MKNNLIVVYIASFVIVAAGLKAASTIVLPFLIAAFIAIIVSPLIDKLESLKIPKILAFLIVVFLIFSSLGFMGNTVIKTINGLLGNITELQTKFKVFTDSMAKIAYEYGFDIKSFLSGDFDPNKIFATFSGFLRESTQIVSKAFFIFLLITFMLFEKSVFEQKVAYFARKNIQAQTTVDTFISNLKRYLEIKFLASFATGVVVFAGLELLGVMYAPLWSILAFILNFIPTIGSIVAALPAILVAMLINNSTTAFWVFLLFLFTNIAIGNFIEPKFLGKGLGISTLVVLLSLLFWGFLFGIGGMFLAIPLTMSLKIALDSNPNTKFIAILLSDKVE